MHLERKTRFDLLKCPYFFPGGPRNLISQYIYLFLLPFGIFKSGTKSKIQIITSPLASNGYHFFGARNFPPFNFSKDLRVLSLFEQKRSCRAVFLTNHILGVKVKIWVSYKKLKSEKAYFGSFSVENKMAPTRYMYIEK